MGGGEGRRGELEGETPEWEGVTAVILAQGGAEKEGLMQCRKGNRGGC